MRFAFCQGVEEAGTDMAQMLTQKESIAKKRGMSPEVAKALARLSSGLYVVTATNNSARGAMVSRALPCFMLLVSNVTYQLAHDPPHKSFCFPTHAETKSLAVALTVPVYCRHHTFTLP